MRFELLSNVFSNGKIIPSKYTCDGMDISPPLTWNAVPANKKSLALIIDDPDAPDPKAPKMTWVHWILYNISPHVSELPEGVQSENLPPGSMQGLNNWKRTEYGGPCPPIGRHRYFHKLYALDTLLTGLAKPTKEELEVAMANHIIAHTELVGTYQKNK